MLCEICYIECDPTDYDNHLLKCIDEQEKLFEQFQNKQEISVPKTDNLKLTESQEKAVLYFKRKSKAIAKNMKLLTLAKFQFKGYTEDELNKCVEYIKTIPIIIHLHLEKHLQFLIKDTQYRNQFETNTSSGVLSKESRMEWEKNLFGKMYDDCQGYERVKYGVLNILSQSEGVVSAYSYGDSYLELKNKVKERSSFVLGDSSQKQFQICSFDTPIQLLYYVDDNLLNEIINKALNNKITNLNCRYIYIELQIHGPVRLSEDVEWLVVNKKYENNKIIMDQVHDFCKQHNVKYKFM